MPISLLKLMGVSINAMNKGIAYIPHMPKIPTKEDPSKLAPPPNVGYKTPTWVYTVPPAFRRDTSASRVSPSPSQTSKAGDVENPPTPMPDDYEIDDEFNLPISLAIFLLIIYMMLGAISFTFWEKWSFFEAFYFV